MVVVLKRNAIRATSLIPLRALPWLNPDTASVFLSNPSAQSDCALCMAG